MTLPLHHTKLDPVAVEEALDILRTLAWGYELIVDGCGQQRPRKISGNRAMELSRRALAPLGVGWTFVPTKRDIKAKHVTVGLDGTPYVKGR